MPFIGYVRYVPNTLNYKMTLYIDTKLNFSDGNVVSTVGSWHPLLPLLAVGSYNQEKGGFVTIFHETVS